MAGRVQRKKAKRSRIDKQWLLLRVHELMRELYDDFAGSAIGTYDNNLCTFYNFARDIERHVNG